MTDPVHRLLNAFEPSSYVRPHRHRDPPKHETLAVLRGRGAVVAFDDGGAVSAVAVLTPSGPQHVAEVPAGTWHTLVALEPGTVYLEVKEGPYAQPAAADWAPWAPDPSAPGAADWLEALRRRVSRSSA
jgi:cupin fold WbuC family metalloprotein